MTKSHFRIPNPLHVIGKWLARQELSVKRKYEPYKPALEGCKEGRYGLHRWEWNTMWNGNHRRVLPFETRTDGIARAGHRCYYCGQFKWEKTDEEFALWYAHKLGYIPGSHVFLRTGQWPEAKKTAA